ncbi:MAG: hypothetical protein ACOX37_10845 [Bacillota bacterium]
MLLGLALAASIYSSRVL